VPAIIKTATLGYDGKGQVRINTAADAEGVFDALGGVPLVYEGFVNFDCELSCLGVRDRQGHTAFYSLVENEHIGGMLYRSVATEDHPLQQLAEDYTARVLDTFDYCGVLAFEFFRVGDTLVANEIAPRVHNSGHWTIEAAETSQFENHLRAIAGLPLGSTRRLGHVAMFNLIGRLPDINEALAIPGASFHSYAKKPKPGRKLGHITAHSVDQQVYDEACAALERIVDNDLAPPAC
ncbi:MAG: ATP-grasp domain-containing protein, partial [Gammaproteobacteria bacterium]|nr:ATP-grasp domain-containing protein [Gammaproteobacteria bacterium]